MRSHPRHHLHNDSLHQYFIHLHGKDGRRSSLEETDSCSQGDNSEDTTRHDEDVDAVDRAGNALDKTKNPETRSTNLILHHQPLFGRSRTPSIKVDFETPKKDTLRLPRSSGEEAWRLLPRERRKSGQEGVMSPCRRSSEAHSRRGSEAHSRRSSEAQSRRGSTLSYVLYQVSEGIDATLGGDG